MLPDLSVELTQNFRHPKFQKLIDYQQITDKVMIQNLYSGNVRLVRESHINMHTMHRMQCTGRANDGRRPFDVAPRERLVPKDERKDLWRAWVEYLYREWQLAHHESNIRNFVGNLAAIRKDMGDFLDLDPELLEDKEQRRAQVEYRRDKIALDALVEERKEAKVAFADLTVWLKALATKYRAERDAIELKDRERVVFDRAKVEARARQMANKEFDDKYGDAAEGVRAVGQASAGTVQTASEPAVLVADPGRETLEGDDTSKAPVTSKKAGSSRPRK